MQFDFHSFEENGFAFVPALLDEDRVTSLATSFSNIGASAGLRHLIDNTAVLELLAEQALAKLVQSVLSPKAFAFKATLFDKNAESNWLVAWHRDVSIPVDCVGRRGDAVLLRPLLLHASSKSRSLARRWVLHIEFADFDLPQGLAWHRRIAM